MTKWFKLAVGRRAPYTLGSWAKGKPASARRRAAISSRPSNWSLHKKRLSAGRALLALANVTQDRATRNVAKRDSKYFFEKLKRR